MMLRMMSTDDVLPPRRPCRDCVRFNAVAPMPSGATIGRCADRERCDSLAQTAWPMVWSYWSPCSRYEERSA